MPSRPQSSPKPASTTARGHQAEQLAAEYLVRHGYAVLDRNWRNRWCEIDIVARHPDGVHFVEVKYRANTSYGYAAEYISRDKSARLRRAALAWIQAHGYNGPYQIDVVAVEGGISAPSIQHLPNAIYD